MIRSGAAPSSTHFTISARPVHAGDARATAAMIASRNHEQPCVVHRFRIVREHGLVVGGSGLGRQGRVRPTVPEDQLAATCRKIIQVRIGGVQHRPRQMRVGPSVIEIIGRIVPVWIVEDEVLENVCAESIAQVTSPEQVRPTIETNRPCPLRRRWKSGIDGAIFILGAIVDGLYRRALFLRQAGHTLQIELRLDGIVDDPVLEAILCIHLFHDLAYR